MKRSYRIEPSPVVGREEQSLDAMMVATRTVAQHRESDLARLSEATEIDEFILTEMCKEVASLFGEDVEELDKMSVNVVHVMRKSLAGVMEGTVKKATSESTAATAATSASSSSSSSYADRYSMSNEDAEEQKKLLQFFEEQKRKQLKEKEEQERKQTFDRETREAQEDNFTDMIEVTPGMSLPLRSSEATFRAILTEKTAAVKCFGCQQTLTTPSDVAFVICSDCWICMAIDQPKQKNLVAPGPSKKKMIGLGVKDEAIAKWMAKRKSCRH